MRTLLMAKKYNPYEISSTLEEASDLFQPSTSNVKSDRDDDENEKTPTKKPNDRKLPDWMLKAAQEEPLKPNTNERKQKHTNLNKSQLTVDKSPLKNKSLSNDIYIMSDEDLLEVARFFLKNK